MYNKLHLKEDKTGKIIMTFNGNLSRDEVVIRYDYRKTVGDNVETVFLGADLNKKEVKEVIEYLQEFLRLSEEGE